MMTKKGSGHENETPDPGFLYGTYNIKRNWRAGLITSAFKNYLSFHFRIPSMKEYYNRTDSVICKVYKLLNLSYTPGDAKKIKAQISLLLTACPAGIAIPASLGNTAWVQYKKLTGSKTPVSPPASTIQLGINLHRDMEHWKAVYTTISEAVDDRLACEEMRKTGLVQVDVYRYCLSNYNKLRFSDLHEIIRTVVLFGDLIPDPDLFCLHPVTLEITKKLLLISVPFFNRVLTSEIPELVGIGKEWTRAQAECLLTFLPAADQFDGKSNHPHKDGLALPAKQYNIPGKDEKFPGFNVPERPAISSPGNLSELMLTLLGNPASSQTQAVSGIAVKLPEEITSFINEISKIVNVVQGASSQGSKSEDIREDLLINNMINNPFSNGLVEGTNAEGCEVEIDTGNGVIFKGEIFERSFEPSFDEEEIRHLISSAEILTRKLRANLYPSTENISFYEKFRTSGVLDGNQLHGFLFSEAVFKRMVRKTLLTRHGKPVIIILVDGSGSMSKELMHMVKILTTAWISSCLHTPVRILGALYNTTRVDGSRSGPVIQYFAHEKKAVVNSKKEILRTVANIPNAGEGGQADALAISKIISEGQRLTKQQIYLIHLTDTGFIPSFGQGFTAEDEIIAIIENKRRTLPDRFHYTLVGLGIQNCGKVSSVADKVIMLSAIEIKNPVMAAEKLSMYISSCIRERSRFLTN